MIDQSGATTDNAELIARLRARRAMYTNDYGWSWRQSTVSDTDCQAAANALAKADKRIAEQQDALRRAGNRIDAQADTIAEAVKQISALAREAGEATGKLEISETAGVVEGWKERAKIAEAKVDELERKVYQPGVWRCAKCDFQLVQSTLNVKTGTVTARDDPGTKCPNDGSPMWRVSYQEDNAKAWKWGEEQFNFRQAAEARATALEARVKVLEETLTDAIGDLAITLRNAFMGWECSESELLDRYRTALAQSGEG